jgi:hypothetical protein
MGYAGMLRGVATEQKLFQMAKQGKKLKNPKWRPLTLWLFYEYISDAMRPREEVLEQRVF